MNWVRMVLDGFMMAAYFNLFAAAVAIYNPRLMFPCYPPSIIKDAPEPPTKGENRFYMIWICFGEILPLIIYGSVSMIEGGTRGFGWMVLYGAVRLYPVDDDRLCGLVFLRCLADPEKMQEAVYYSRNRGASRL